MLFLLPSHRRTDDVQQLRLRRPRAQLIPEGHLRVAKQANLVHNIVE
jgi:hypothetical protein